MKELFVILLINLFQKGFCYGQGDFDRMRRLEFKNSQLQSRLLNIERKLETQQAAQGDLNNKVEFIRINRDIKFEYLNQRASALRNTGAPVPRHFRL